MTPLRDTGKLKDQRRQCGHRDTPMPGFILVAGVPVGDGTLQVVRPDLGRLRHVHGSGPLRWHFGNPTDTRELTPETATHIGQMLLDENADR